MFGALLALVSAAFFGLNNAALRRGVVKGTVLQAMAITVPFGVPFFVLLAALMGGFEAMAGWGVAPWVWMILAGVVHFVVGRYGNYRATQLLGGALSTPIQQVSVLIALLLAFIFLGESVNAVNIVGILLVMLGPIVMIRRRTTTTKAGRDKGFEPKYGPGLFWGSVCALGYGTSPLFVALGIGDGGIADSIGGVLVSYTAAALVVVVWIIAIGGRAGLGEYKSGTMGWFLASAVFVALSQLFRYVAMAVAPVSVVVPIQRLSVVFRLIFAALINRDHEVFDRWVTISILLSVSGAVALAADTQGLLGLVGVTALDWIVRPLF